MRRSTMKYRAVGWLAVAGLVAGAIAGPTVGIASAAPLNGAIWTSLADGTSVNANLYDNKSDVYLNGGPQNCGNGNGLPDGDYYFQVTDPSGGDLLSTDAIKFRQVQVVNGVIDGVSGEGNHLEGSSGCNGGTPVQLMPYADTSNNGGEYSLDLAPVEAVQACEGFDADEPFNFLDCNTESKNDNFKVGEAEPTPTPTPSPTPTPTPTPSPTPTPEPGVAHIFLTKFLDQDGNPNTVDDLIEGEGWTFDITVEGGTSSDDSVTTDAAGEGEFDVTIDGTVATVTMSEQGQEGFEVLWADCAVIIGEGEFGDAFGDLNGSDLTIDVEPATNYDCVFVNTGGEVEEATGTPAVTPPPTDTLSTSTPSSDGTRLLLLVMAGVIATLLIVTPAPAAVRRRR